jgi:3-oxoacyl-[acyl-carrier-protein] synthase II
MKKVYVNGLGSISAQKTFDNAQFLNEVVNHESNTLHVISPNYKDFIGPAVARRMEIGIKMGLAASKIAIQDAGINNVGAIITGTGMGCVRDSEKFLKDIIDNNEQYLTPTSFIQSTHNTVGGQIALELKCKGYNFTYVHSSISFESALIDAKLQLEEDEETTILVGGVDELGDHTVAMHRLINHIKPERPKAFELLKSNTEGAVFGEGANFFVISNEKSKTSYAEILSVKTFNTLSKIKLEAEAIQFLKSNNLEVANIDLLILGYNGDVSNDSFYVELTTKAFKNTQQAYYKHLCGEFNTASSFGFWLALKILKSQTLPDVVKLNVLKTTNFKTILLYNQYRGDNHSFTLLQQC